MDKKYISIILVTLISLSLIIAGGLTAYNSTVKVDRDIKSFYDNLGVGKLKSSDEVCDRDYCRFEIYKDIEIEQENPEGKSSTSTSKKIVGFIDIPRRYCSSTNEEGTCLTYRHYTETEMNKMREEQIQDKLKLYYEVTLKRQNNIKTTNKIGGEITLTDK